MHGATIKIDVNMLFYWTGGHKKSIAFLVLIFVKLLNITSHYEIFYIEFHPNLQKFV